MTETDMTIATRAKRGAEMAGGPATLNSRAPGWFVGGLRCTHVSSHSRRLRLCGEEKSHSKPAAGVDENRPSELTMPDCCIAAPCPGGRGGGSDVLRKRRKDNAQERETSATIVVTAHRGVS